MTMSRQIISKDNDLQIISKIFEFLAEGHDIKRSRTCLDIKDANDRVFRYVSIKDWPNESKRCSNGKVEVRRIEEAFRNIVKRMSDKGTPQTSPYAYIEDNEDNQEEEEEEGEEEGEEEDSNQED